MMRRSYRRGGAEMVDDNLVALMDVLNKTRPRFEIHVSFRSKVACCYTVRSDFPVGFPVKLLKFLTEKGLPQYGKLSSPYMITLIRWRT